VSTTPVNCCVEFRKVHNRGAKDFLDLHLFSASVCATNTITLETSGFIEQELYSVFCSSVSAFSKLTSASSRDAVGSVARQFSRDEITRAIELGRHSTYHH
jgi:hypothetical protein